MKIEKPGIFLLIIFTCCMQQVFAQPERYSGTIRVKKPADVNPRIAGKNAGDITPGELCNSQGIYVTQPGIKILAFEISLGEGSTEITSEFEGNVIDDQALCMRIQKMEKGNLVHIYNILAQDEAGRKFTLAPLRFSIVPAVVEVKSIYLSGFYQQKLDYVPMNKKYIKIGNPESHDSGPLWVISSVGEPVVLNQVCERNYSSDGIVHGRYRVIEKDSIILDFDEQFSPYDYRGKIVEGRLELNVVSHDGTIYEQKEKYIILPFSRINR